MNSEVILCAFCSLARLCREKRIVKPLLRRGGRCAGEVGNMLSILKTDSYVELSEYRDQHFKVGGGSGSVVCAELCLGRDPLGTRHALALVSVSIETRQSQRDSTFRRRSSMKACLSLTVLTHMT